MILFNSCYATLRCVEELKKKKETIEQRDHHTEIILKLKLHLFSLSSESLSGCYGSQSMRMDRNQLRLNRLQLRLNRFQLRLDCSQLPLDFTLARANFVLAHRLFSDRGTHLHSKERIK